MVRKTTHGDRFSPGGVADLTPIIRRMPTSPGPLLHALSDLWERLRIHVPELPPITPTVSPTVRRQDHGPERWTEDEDGSVSGLVMTADVLQGGAELVLQTVLHDAAHLLNWRRGVSDTTMRGVYHNASFLTAAEEVCLEWPADAERVKGRGYPDPVVGDAARERHAVDLRALEEAIPPLLPHLGMPTSSGTGRVDRLTLRCQCKPPRIFRISRTVAAQGPIRCGVCGEDFAAE